METTTLNNNLVEELFVTIDVEMGKDTTIDVDIEKYNKEEIANSVIDNIHEVVKLNDEFVNLLFKRDKQIA